MILEKQVLITTLKQESFKKYLSQIVNLLIKSNYSNHITISTLKITKITEELYRLASIKLYAQKIKTNNSTSLINEGKTTTNPNNIVGHFSKFFTRTDTNI